MINGDIEMFVDTLHYGTDIYLIYGNQKVFIDGWWEDEIYTLRMIDLSDIKKKDSIYNFEISGKDREKVVEEFLNKKIWNGKGFYEEAMNIEWSEPF